MPAVDQTAAQDAVAPMEAAAPAPAAPEQGSLQPERPDVFLSYSRTDQEFARALAAALEARGKNVWADWEDIEPSSVWWQRIERGIDSATAFAVVISPDQLASETCLRELDSATSGNKRIVPILRRRDEGMQLPPALADLNWILAEADADFEAAVDRVNEALDTDLAWRDVHARLLVRAREWAGAEGNASFLLRGRDLEAAEAWRDEQGSHNEAATALQLEYVAASRAATTRRQRLVIGALALGLMVAAALAGVALLERSQAIGRARVAQSREYAASSLSLVGSNPALAVAVARAAEEVTHTPEATAALRTALAAAYPSVSIPAVGAGVTDAAVDRHGGILATGSTDGIVRVWRVRPLRLVRSLGSRRAADDPLQVVYVAVSANGRYVASSRNGVVFLWDRRTGQPVFTAKPRDPFDNYPRRVELSPGGDLVASAAAGGWDPLEVWDWRRRRVRRLGGNVLGFAFDPSGRRIAAASHGGLVRTWSVPDGRPLVSFQAEGFGGLEDVAYGRGGYLATAGSSGVQIWPPHFRTGQTILRSLDATAVDFGGDGSRLVVGESSGVADVVRTSSGQVAATLRTGQGNVLQARLSADGRAVVTVGGDGTAREWKQTSPFVATLPDGAVAVAPDAPVAAVAEASGDVSLWGTRTGRALRILRDPRLRRSRPAGEADTGNVTFAARGGELVASTVAGVRVWDWRRGRSLASSPVVAESSWFDPAGDTIFSSEWVDYRRVWSWHWRSGKPPELLPESDWGVGPTESAPHMTASVGGDGGRVTVRRGGRIVASLPGEGAAVFSPDGRYVLVIGQAARVWDWRSGKVVATLPTRTRLLDATFAGSDVVATLDGEGTASAGIALRLWDWRTGEVVAELEVGPGSNGLLSDGAGQIVVTGAPNALYRCEVCVPPPTLLRLADERFPAPLTRAERALYLHQP